MQGGMPDLPRRTVERHLAAAARTLCTQELIVFEVGGDARERSRLHSLAFPSIVLCGYPPVDVLQADDVILVELTERYLEYSDRSVTGS